MDPPFPASEPGPLCCLADGTCQADPKRSSLCRCKNKMSQRHNPRTCFDRVGEPVANTVLFLCSDLDSAIIGAQYVVGGARTATGGAVIQAMQS